MKVLSIQLPASYITVSDVMLHSQTKCALGEVVVGSHHLEGILANGAVLDSQFASRSGCFADVDCSQQGSVVIKDVLIIERVASTLTGA